VGNDKASSLRPVVPPLLASAALGVFEKLVRGREGKNEKGTFIFFSIMQGRLSAIWL